MNLPSLVNFRMRELFGFSPWPWATKMSPLLATVTPVGESKLSNATLPHLEARVRDVGETPLAILLQAATQESSQGRRCLRGQRREVRLALKDPREHIGDLITIKGALSRQHLIDHAPECPDVGAPVH